MPLAPPPPPAQPALQQNTGSNSCAAPDLNPLHGDEAALLQPYLPKEALIPAEHACSPHATAAAAAMRSSSAAQALLKLLCQMRSGVTEGLLLLQQRSSLGLLTLPQLVEWRTATLSALQAWLSAHAPDKVPASKAITAVHDAVASVLADARRRTTVLTELRRMWLSHLDQATGMQYGSSAAQRATQPPGGGSAAQPATQPPCWAAQPPGGGIHNVPPQPPEGGSSSGLQLAPLGGGSSGLQLPPLSFGSGGSGGL